MDLILPGKSSGGSSGSGEPTPPGVALLLTAFPLLDIKIRALLVMGNEEDATPLEKMLLPFRNRRLAADPLSADAIGLDIAFIDEDDEEGEHSMEIGINELQSQVPRLRILHPRLLKPLSAIAVSIWARTRTRTITKPPLRLTCMPSKQGRST